MMALLGTWTCGHCRSMHSASKAHNLHQYGKDYIMDPINNMQKLAETTKISPGDGALDGVEAEK